MITSSRIAKLRHVWGIPFHSVRLIDLAKGVWQLTKFTRQIGASIKEVYLSMWTVVVKVNRQMFSFITHLEVRRVSHWLIIYRLHSIKSMVNINLTEVLPEL